MTKTKRSLILSVVSLLLCVVMLAGSTFAWFTDSVTSGKNIIVSGNLDVELEYLNADGEWTSVKDKTDLFDQNALWEPGHTETVYLRVSNLGSLALKYKLGVNIVDEIGSMNVLDEEFKLSDYIKFGAIDNVETPYADRAAARAAVKEAKLIRQGYTKENAINAGDPAQYIALVVYMPETVGNEANYKTGCAVPKIELGVTLVATQMTSESDDFGNTYDEKAEFPQLKEFDVVIDVTVENGAVKQTTTVENVTVPAGVKVQEGTTQLGASVKEKESSDANLTLDKDEIMKPLDVHVEGVAADNTVPLIIKLGEVMPKGLNIGNYTLYHVENDANVAMTAVSAVQELDAHNEFYYDPATGEVTVAMATFSEVALVVEEPKWEGATDHTWYDADATELTIANADQLWSFSQIVGGMAKDEDGNFLITYTDSDGDEHHNDTFAGKTVKLISDINLGDDEDNNVEGKIFYPIGYYNSEGTYEKTGTAIFSGFYTFEGTFDGNGNTVSNFYQNTWEMKGDHNWYDAILQYYRDGMGLFGKVYGGTVKNLTVDNFSSDGEITTTGVIAAYAEGATFENIAITNCNPRVYNIGNGGIVGCVGWYAKEADLKTTFKNITVDNSNKISALWGSYDVACGGIVGQYYPTSGQTVDGAKPANAGIHFENCHVAAQMDVYNDVCANYQYYAYRYTGMMIGSVRENETIDGHVYPKMDGITASGCTVHFGDWNDYYYCELVANTTASYTHDHQMSRLTQVAKVEETTITPLEGEAFTVPSSGRYHYVVVNGEHATENATCYHFVDGEVWNHANGGYEEKDIDGDGVIDSDVLKEDKQHIYLEFNNLFTGYGWGVTSKGIGDLDGVTILGRTEANSVSKFESLGKTELSNGIAIKASDLFAYIESYGVKIIDAALQISVVDLDDTDGTVTAVFDRAEAWGDSTITLTGTGKVKITIQDYYFCTPTTIEVTVTERQNEEKFEVAFDHDSATEGRQNNVDTYLYRVGNQNTVSLGSLFGALDGAEIGTVSVTIEAVDSTGVSGTYTANTSDWAKGTIQFSGTGVVKVTITDNDYCIPTVLHLEVVDAKNITSATGSSGTDVVLLNDVTISSGGAVHYTNCAVYGNGFTFDVRGGMNQYNSAQGHGIIITNGATIDNLVVIGDVYDTYGAYTSQEDYTGAFDATNTTFTNCHISNCATPIRANGVTIKNTTLYGGTIANLIISGGTNTLKNVTTVNYNDGRGVLGFGIVISDGANENVKLVLNGELKQYNFVCADDANSVPDDNAKKLFNAMFDSTYSAYHFGADPVYVNTGILSMVSTFDASDITDNTGNGYAGTIVSYSTGLGTAEGYLYSLPASGNSVDNGYNAETDSHKATAQGDYLPTFEFDLGDQTISNDGADDTRYLTGDASGVEALYQNNESPITLDLTKLATVYKYSGTNYTVNVSYKDANGNVLGTDTTVSLTSSGTLVFTVTDNVFYDKNGEKLDKSVERSYEVPLTVSVKQAAIKNAVLTITTESLTGTYTAAGVFDNSQYLSFNPLEAITVTDYDANGTETTVDLTANISTTTVSYVNTTSGAWGGATITISYTDGRVLTIVLGSTTMNSPGASNGGKTITVTNGAVKSDGKVAKSSATGGTWPITSYSFKGNNGSTVSSTEDESVTVSFADASGCVTGDTLVTLADGTQKRIDQVTYADQLLVWNFFTGEYDVVPSAIIFYHGDAEYDILNLKFDDGTVVKVINNHGFYNVESNQFVFIEEGNVDEYIGHHFVKVDGGTYKSVELIGYEMTQEYTGCYSIQSAMHNNFMVEGMFSLTIPHYDGWFDYFEIGEGMKYDEEKMQADIELYGLYTYEDFAEYVTYEQFIAFNGPYLKVLVGRGVVTYEQIIELISMYVPQ